MSQLQHWQLAITPLSPVHLGTGQDYEPTGYVIDDGALFEFDGIAALQALPAAERERSGQDPRRSPAPRRCCRRSSPSSTTTASG